MCMNELRSISEQRDAFVPSLRWISKLRALRVLSLLFRGCHSSEGELKCALHLHSRRLPQTFRLACLCLISGTCMGCLFLRTSPSA